MKKLFFITVLFVLFFSSTFAFSIDVNVKNYGALGNGSTANNTPANNLTAFNNAISAIKTSGGGSLYIPSGTYMISNTLLINSSAIKIYGEGIGVTKLVWTGGTDGIKITQSEVPEQIYYPISIRDISLLQSQNNIGSAIHINIQVNGSRAVQHGIIENVEIGPYQLSQASNQSWINGIWMENVMNIWINNISIVSSFAKMANGILYTDPGQIAPIDLNISNINMFGVQTGISLSGHFEGIKIDQCNLVQCLVGINLQGESGHRWPYVHIRGNHIEYIQHGITISNQSQVFISNNLLYSAPPTDQRNTYYPHDSCAIGVSNAEDIFISDNNIINVSKDPIYNNNNFHGIVVSNSNNIKVYSNTINKFCDDVWFQSGTQYCKAYDNENRECTNHYVNNGSNNYMNNRW